MLEQFTDLSYKPYMMINANTVEAENFAVTTDGIVTFQPANSIATPFGGAATHPIITSVSQQTDVDTISYNESAVFSAINATMPNVIGATNPIVFTSPTLAGYNYSFDGTYVGIDIGGYYKVDFCANIGYTANANVLQFTINFVDNGGSILFSNSLVNPTNGLLTNNQSYYIGSSAYVKLIAGHQYFLQYVNNVSGLLSDGVLNNLALNMVLIDPVSN
jgi:hypothetical protein